MQSQFLSRCAILLAAVFWLPDAGAGQETKPELRVGDEFFIKDHVRLEVDGKRLDPELDLSCPAFVRERLDDQIRTERIWLKRADVMTVDEALAYYSANLEKNPKSLKALRGRANCYLLKKESKKARADIEQALKLSPKDARTLICRGNLAYAQDRVDEALRFYKEAIEVSPNSFAPRYLIAWVHSNAKKKEYDAALAELEEILRLDPKCEHAALQQAVIYQSVDRDREAFAIYDKLLDLHPAEDDLLNKRGGASLLLQDYDKAEADFSQVIARSPADAAAFHGRALARLASNKLDGGLKDAAKAIQLDPNLAEAHHTKAAILLVQSNDLQGAALALDECIRLAPRKKKYRITRAYLHFNLNDREAAIKDLDEALLIAPGDPQASILLATYYMVCEKKDIDGALKVLDTAIAHYPKNAELYYNRAQGRSYFKDFDAALADFDLALKLDSKNAEWMSDRGVTKFCVGDYAGALKDFDDALSLDPQLTAAMQAKLLLLTICPEEKFRDALAAARLLATLEKTERDSGCTKAARGCLLALRGEFEEAIKLQQEALEDASYAEDSFPLTGSTEAQSRIAAWKEGKLWTSRR